MNIEGIKDMDTFDRFLYWIQERESIRIKKESGAPWPWTDDKILQTYRFCNVRRMDDRVSRWLMDNWYTPNKNHKNTLIAVAMARMLNNPESLEAIGYLEEWNPDDISRVLHSRMINNQKNFSAAYMITGTLGGTKVHQVVWKVVDELHRNPPEIDTDSMEITASRLMPYNGFSSFMAGQVVADLRWCLDGTWSDRNTWAPIGPGSMRGVNVLYGRPMYDRIKKDEFQRMFMETMTRVINSLPEYITSRLESHDYQNCLCEFHKYHKALFGFGKPKQLYRG